MKADLPQMVFFTKKNGIRSWYGKLEKKITNRENTKFVVIRGSSEQ